jgi:hypothetical protein
VNLVRYDLHQLWYVCRSNHHRLVQVNASSRGLVPCA